MPSSIVPSVLQIDLPASFRIMKADIMITTTTVSNVFNKINNTRNHFRRQRAHHPKSSSNRCQTSRKMAGGRIPDVKERHH